MSTLASTMTAYCQYRYDALDRLASTAIEAQAPVWPFYQRSRLSVEIQGALHRRVVRVQDRLLAEQHVDGSVGQVVLLGTDVQDSVLQALDGHGSQPFGYSPYGHRPPANTFLGFNGERPDPLTGHYWLGNGYRAFNPVLMRFNQPDSLSPFGRGGLNAYAYCLGNPVNRRDPEGHVSLALYDLPDVVLSNIFKSLSMSDVSNLRYVSVRLNDRVMGLSKIPDLDINNSGALAQVKRHLQGWTHNVLPHALRRHDGYKAAFERLAQHRKTEAALKVRNAEARMQSIIERVAGKGADVLKFDRYIQDAMQINAGSPGTLGDIAAVKKTYNDSFSEHYQLRVAQENLKSDIRAIRFNLNR
ncbi:hypothetical protein ASF84_20730 [Pseudomonas sp. Leaf127]|uniref:RHS repeat-associated core domain-containing protein n=1 Tax=Pseudomonas sp. Leaf127 TaxID=1736267 RepID=UPI0007027964|nr:RHS repeat-associated core domain-containing protein [Pseudomonas sp. Leaf127]KQQ50699.1 hypothetical protein ASF84_20730 [Pseudomonas sp. Leaf127]